MRESLSRLVSSLVLRIVIGALISLLTLYLAFQNVNLRDVRQAIGEANAGYLWLALLSVVLNNVFKALRWQVMLGARGQGIDFWPVQMSHLSGQMLNTLSPARVGEITRTYEIGRLGPGKVFVLGTILVEKVLDMIAYALLFGCLLLLIPLPGWINNSGYTFVGVTLLVSLVVAFVTVRREAVLRFWERLERRLPERAARFVSGRMHSGLSSLDVLQNQKDAFKLAFWSALIWVTALLNIYLALVAFHIDLPLTASLLLLIALQAGISIPSAPGKVGIFEYACVLALGVFGIQQAQAFSYGVVLHAIVFLPMIAAGLVSFWLLRSWRKDNIAGNFSKDR